ncbi:MAG: glycyl radical protein [Phycisphaerae bacterium]|nr:glycyl radical protein [Phycisphaerae bacterium]
MNERVKRLRRESTEMRPYISTERAELMTRFYKTYASLAVSPVVFRAMAFHSVMANKRIYIGEGELIVGERGGAPKATPTYPELCCHDVEDLRVLSSRDRTPFDVSPEAMKIYEEVIIPFWRGKTQREKVFAAMSPEWQRAFDAGVFTEFMEQRAPGHAILDDKIYHYGMMDFKQRIARKRNELNFLSDPEAYSKDQQYQAMDICADAIMLFAGRHAEEARRQAIEQTDPVRREELSRIASICDRVPAHAPRDFHEALQAYWFVHLGVITELNTWDSFNPGRLDQHLHPFYRRQIEAGTLTEGQARELVQCFWIKFNNHPAPPKVAITEEQSGTYTDFALINIGGLRADGSDGVNEVSYMLLDVVEEMRLVQPSACIQISKKTPNRFLKRACEVIRTGFGQPSVFNTDVIIQEMLQQGKKIADARSGGPSGCVEISAFGKESCCLTGYCNWPKILELALNDGRDPRTNIQVGPRTGDAGEWVSFDGVMAAYRKQLQYFVDLKIAGNNIIERLFAAYMPSPFMSLVMDDCIEKGRDYHDGGARYNTTYIQGVGIGSLTDALAGIKYHVFDRKTVTLAELTSALTADFEGYEQLRQTFLNRTPKYGNDDDYADVLAVEAFNAYYDAFSGRPNTKGGRYAVNLLPTTAHIYFGQVTGALPSGRKAGEPVSDGISPSQGIDSQGPTAMIKSAGKIDHARTGGTLLNMKFNPQVLEGEGLDKLAHLIRAYFTMDGHHVQFNVVGAETLRQAQQKPQDYRDLIVRVAGYSDYFIDLGADLQNEIIGRTEQQAL